MTIVIKKIEFEKDRDKLLSIEKAAFQESMASDRYDLESQLRKGFGFLAFEGSEDYKSAVPLGYVIAVPLEKADYPGCNEDTEKGKRNTAYVESFAMMPGANKTTLLRLMRNLGNELESREYARVTMHVESKSKLLRNLKSLGAKSLGDFTNWMDWDKTFSYLEMPLNA